MCRSAGRVSPGRKLSETLVRQVSLPQSPRVADIRILPGPWVLPPGPEPRPDRTDLGQAITGQTRPGLQVLMSWWPAGIGLDTEGAQGGFPKGPGESARGQEGPWSETPAKVKCWKPETAPVC